MGDITGISEPRQQYCDGGRAAAGVAGQEAPMSWPVSKVPLPHRAITGEGDDAVPVRAQRHTDHAGGLAP